MRWRLSPRIDLRNDRVPPDDADRQTLTAAEILRRFDGQPGIVLADEVGMGKSYVALAVAVSVLDATRRRHPVIVMVPSSVADKWPTEWDVFSQRCLKPGHGLRAAGPIRRGSDLLKLLDDPAPTRRHIIFVTHGALTSTLTDPFVSLALLRHATRHRKDLLNRRRSIARFAGDLLNDSRFRDERLVTTLLETPPGRWKEAWDSHRPDRPLDGDPVPFALIGALPRIDLTDLREALAAVPTNRGTTFEARMRKARSLLRSALNVTWTQSLGALKLRLPLIVLDEAHHVRHETQLSRLFTNEESECDADALQGPLGNMFDRMLFLTATPFQLGHNELLRVLDRFHGVCWPSRAARARFDRQLEQLGSVLDRAQASALRLERTWGRLDETDASAVVGLTNFTPQEDQSERLRAALRIASDARTDLHASQALLRPWVIRHVKPHKQTRRRYLAGRGIVDDVTSELGLAVGGPATLPFLLAARAQALASLSGQAGSGSAQAYFAYGLASSFEAYADTRRNRVAALDDQPDVALNAVEVPPQLRWYLDHIQNALPDDTAEGWATHPKITATVARVLDLWRRGEKTLVFCFYVETGRALRSHISRALRTEIITRAATAFNMKITDQDGVLAELDRLGDRLLRIDAPGYDAFRSKVRSHVGELDDETAEQVADVAVRFMRTPSFLVRLSDLSKDLTVDDLVTGLKVQDSTGSSLAGRIEAFAQSVGQKVEGEKQELLTALTGIQTGTIATTAEDFDPSERSQRREALLPHVRLANGGVRQETRRRLMLTFNTPFFPEVLIASSVMAEGVDLHQECRHIVHHDLDWNPSTLEQRTGRVDRIGSKASRVDEPVVVYEPYLAGTHDEKMYRVVKDRERWFGLVMGGTPDASEWATERQAARIPLPAGLAEMLTLDLSIQEGCEDGR